MKNYIVLRVVAKFILPFILIFGFYLQAHGEFSPGGGFQAGVAIASALILYGLIYGLKAAQRVFPRPLAIRLSALGFLLYAGVGCATLVNGSELLNYSVLLQNSVEGQHLGIWLVESGVFLTVLNVMILIYYGFANYRFTYHDASEVQPKRYKPLKTLNKQSSKKDN